MRKVEQSEFNQFEYNPLLVFNVQLKSQGGTKMLMALLYSHDDQILAAAPACDQIPFGDEYWLDFHEAPLESLDFFETAYVTITQPELRDRLMLLGIDESIDGAELVEDVKSSAAPEYSPFKAA